MSGMSKRAFSAQLSRLMDTGRPYTPGELFSLTGADRYMGEAWFRERIRRFHKQYRLMTGDDGHEEYRVITPVDPKPAFSRFYTGVMHRYECLKGYVPCRKL